MSTFREQAEIDDMEVDVRAAAARFELFEYDGTGYLFTDPSLPAEYDRAASELLWSRVLALLGVLSYRLVLELVQSAWTSRLVVSGLGNRRAWRRALLTRPGSRARLLW